MLQGTIIIIVATKSGDGYTHEITGDANTDEYRNSGEEDVDDKSMVDFHIFFMNSYKGGTEPPGTGELLNKKENVTYLCKGCGTELFSSDSKYESGSG